MKKLWIQMLLVCALSGCMFLVGCADRAPQNTDTDTNAAEEQEPYIVSFEANTIDGQAFSSEQFSESKVTMINVWATYCNPCLAEMPDLGDIADSYDKPDFQLVGIISDVMEDSPQSDIDNAKDLIVQTEADYPHLLLNQSLFDNLVGGVSSVPTTFFVNAEGEMLGYVVGANDEDTWEQIIDELLAKEGVIDD